ncbi:MAG: hypothetical protein LC808_21470 [Actinobacteria bacterium]|nr:hypothetical protein [Actinomycetota bacterium]
MPSQPPTYVEPPTIPEGMTCQEYRRQHDGSRGRRFHRRMAARVLRALRG